MINFKALFGFRCPSIVAAVVLRGSFRAAAVVPQVTLNKDPILSQMRDLPVSLGSLKHFVSGDPRTNCYHLSKPWW